MRPGQNTTSASVAAQRAKALVHGTNVRTLRAELKRALRANRANAGPLLSRLLHDPPGYLRTALAYDVLTWMPTYDAPKAEKALKFAGITGPLRTIEELTARQRQMLADAVLDPSVLRRRAAPAKPLRKAAPVLDDIAI